MKKSTVISRLSILTSLHFLVDFVCVFCVVYCYFKLKEFSFAPFTILAYDCIAFLTQPFIGMLVDKDSRKGELSAGIYIVVLFVIIGVLSTHEYVAMILVFKEFGAFIAPVFLGFANSLFHVIGGKETLVMSDKSKLGGIYVSTGAFGLGLGTFLGTMEIYEPSVPIFISLGLMVALAFLHHFTKFEYPTKESQVIYKTTKFDSIKAVIVIVIGICVAIAIRSLLGYAGQKGESILDPSYAILITAGCAVLGKAFGGVLQDFLGARVVIIISTVLGILSLVLPKEVALQPCIFIFSVNLLMPVTLDLIRRLLPKREGFAFGLTAAFVLIGYLVFLLIQEITWLKILSVIITCLTGIMLYFIDYYMRKKSCQI